MAVTDEDREVTRNPEIALTRNNFEETELAFRSDEFAHRHIGPGPQETRQMLDLLGYSDLEALVNAAVPQQIRLGRPLALPGPRSEFETLAALREIAAQNQVFRSYIGMGYYD